LSPSLVAAMRASPHPFPHGPLFPPHFNLPCESTSHALTVSTEFVLWIFPLHDSANLFCFPCVTVSVLHLLELFLPNPAPLFGLVVPTAVFTGVFSVFHTPPLPTCRDIPSPAELNHHSSAYSETSPCWCFLHAFLPDSKVFYRPLAPPLPAQLGFWVVTVSSRRPRLSLNPFDQEDMWEVFRRRPTAPSSIPVLGSSFYAGRLPVVSFTCSPLLFFPNPSPFNLCPPALSLPCLRGR